jgi:hypothetical protein
LFSYSVTADDVRLGAPPRLLRLSLPTGASIRDLATNPPAATALTGIPAK